MSAAVARGHGGDAGGDPPPHPNRIPTVCEATAKQKKKRGKSRSRNLDIAFEANGKNPLPVEFDVKEGTYKPVGKNTKNTQFKQSIIRRLRRFFILDPTVPDWPRILAGIERDCQDQKIMRRCLQNKLYKHKMARPPRLP
ncbi:hypothetical protein L6452_22850 [Arctium lappa]|uniref:Uncharacterized protein n=1 Tax=Arctium lappa TaxID=4217 RepID=A0ACB9B0B9_ARCLA|nr:hypothetical protein L6452_22850 [Arctium lappa]